MPRDYRSRTERLKDNISEELKKDTPDIKNILESVNEFESDNLKTIKKLMRKKKATMNKINGAIRQTIDAHPIVTKELIGSMGKRIYGSLLELEMEERRKISIKDVLIGLSLGIIIMLIFV